MICKKNLCILGVRKDTNETDSCGHLQKTITVTINVKTTIVPETPAIPFL